ncbi:molybdopterin-dependent oxidoreductase [Pseudonocardia sp. MCCB 268]|nr:molybdopterin-dependent oxidoreductase [Pseudonocardia cytotoxica]
MHQASAELIDLAKQRAADLLEASCVEDLSSILERGDHRPRRPVGEVGHAGRALRRKPPSRSTPTWDGQAAHVRSARTSASSRSTPSPGKVTVERIVAVDDAGPVLNPLLCDGQRHGGIAQASRRRC